MINNIIMLVLWVITIVAYVKLQNDYEVMVENWKLSQAQIQSLKKAQKIYFDSEGEEAVA